MKAITKIKSILVTFFCIIFLISCDLLGITIGENEREKEDLTPQFVYAENVVDSLNAIVCSNGYVTLFGRKEIQQNGESSTLERVIYIAKVDLENDVVDDNDVTLIVVDSLYNPIRMESVYGDFFFHYNADYTIDCLYKLSGEKNWKEIKSMQLNNFSTKTVMTRAASEGGASDFTLAGLLKAIDTAMSLNGTMGSHGIKEGASNGLGVVGNLLPNNIAGLASGLISAGLTKNLYAAIVTSLSALAQSGVDVVEKYLGHMYISIDDLKVIDNNSFSFNYTATGFSELGLMLADLRLLIYKDYKFQKYIELPVKEGSGSKVVSGLSPGKYQAELSVTSM